MVLFLMIKLVVCRGVGVCFYEGLGIGESRCYKCEFSWLESCLSWCNEVVMCFG